MYQRILVPIDGSDTAARHLQEALKLGNSTALLRLVYVVEEVYALDAEASFHRLCRSATGGPTYRGTHAGHWPQKKCNGLERGRKARYLKQMGSASPV